MLDIAIEWLQKAVKHLDVEFSRIQMWMANPMIVEDIMVEQFGSLQPLKNVASVSTLDAQTLNIKPWDKGIITAIGKAIADSGKGLNPQTMADAILIQIPPLTQERRQEMVKVVKKLSEDAKVSVRNVRADCIKEIKKAEDNKEISEDQKKDYEDKLQKEVASSNASIDDKTKKKSEDIMKV